MLWNPKLELDLPQEIIDFYSNTPSHIRRVSNDVGLTFGNNPSPYHRHDCRAVMFQDVDSNIPIINFVRFQYEFVPIYDSDFVSLGAIDLIDYLNCDVKPLHFTPSRRYLEERFSGFGSPVSVISKKGDSFIYVPGYLNSLPYFMQENFDCSRINFIPQ